MVDISSWMYTFVEMLNETFKSRIWFVGLQGSYARKEATESSDIDVVVILDKLNTNDIETYNSMLDTLPHRERICGFLSGKQEILSWEPADLFQFYFDTRPVQGNLDALKPLLNKNAVNRAIRISACNIYHACVHNMLHEKSDDVLRGLYKSALFTVQATYYSQTGVYICGKNELLNVLPADERTIVEIALELKNGSSVQFNKMSETLFLWAKKLITGLDD